MAIRAEERKRELDERMRALAFAYMTGYNTGGNAVFSTMEEWAGLKRTLEGFLRAREISRVIAPYDDFLCQLAFDTCVEMDKIITTYDGEENPTKEFAQQTLTAFRRKLQSFYHAGLHRNGYLSRFGSTLIQYRAFEQRLTQDLRDLEAGRPISRLELASQADSGMQNQPIDVTSLESQDDISATTESAGNYPNSPMLRDNYWTKRQKARGNGNGHFPSRRPEDIALEQQVIEAWNEKGQKGPKLASDASQAVNWYRKTHRRNFYSPEIAKMFIMDHMAARHGYPAVVFGRHN